MPHMCAVGFSLLNLYDFLQMQVIFALFGLSPISSYIFNRCSTLDLKMYNLPNHVNVASEVKFLELSNRA